MPNLSPAADSGGLVPARLLRFEVQLRPRACARCQRPVEFARPSHIFCRRCFRAKRKRFGRHG